MSFISWLYDLLKAHVTEVLVCNPRKNALLKEGSKGDQIDARKLAELLRLIHGLLFTTWILLLIAQVTLVFSGRVNWHMRLDIFGMVLAGLMVLVGFATLVGTARPLGNGQLPFFPWDRIGLLIEAETL
jgi:hypothetical protein